MCGLFGFSQYGNNGIKNLDELTNSLARQSAVRGTDATGIAMCNKGKINIIKDSKSAFKLEFTHKDNVPALMAHTRRATQGSERKNYNNHPFYGRTKNANFAFAHNGVLINDRELRARLNLPRTKIETDSYIGVQLIESMKKLNMSSIKYMAETVEGSFSFTLLDNRNNLYIVKGDSPISLLHFPAHKIYVYASTNEILYKALVDSPLFKSLRNGDFEEIAVEDGTILKISSSGHIESMTFDYQYNIGKSWWEYGYGYSKEDTAKDEYVECLKSVAIFEGFDEKVIDDLLNEGFSMDEIEEYIYC